MAFTLSLSDPAREWLNKLINKDGQFKDLSVKIGYNPEDFATVSGHVESDYSVPHLNLGGQLEFEKSTSIPPELWEKLGSAKQCCHMGVFPQCRKAWLTVDSDFFIWNFDDGEDLAFYDGCQDIIIAVCLFRPKPGVLPASIGYLLALASPSELNILGVTYDYTALQVDQYSNGLLNVLPTPLYQLSTDNNYITYLEGTQNGRLFMGNREGDLIEFTFGPIPELQCSNATNFTLNSSGPCCLINHTASSLSFLLPTILASGFRSSGYIVQIVDDAQRGLLWVLSSNSNLAVYQYHMVGVKTAPNYLSKLASLSGSEFMSRAASAVRSIDRNNFLQIVAISALVSAEDGPVKAMAVTSTGVRVFFGDSLRIVHVRLPPRTLAAASPPLYATGDPFVLGDVKLVAESRGTVVFASIPPSTQIASSPQQSQTSTPNNNPTLTLFVASPDAFPWSVRLTETMTTSLSVEAPWAITVLPEVDAGAFDYSPSLSVSATSFSKKGIELPHEPSFASVVDSQTFTQQQHPYAGQQQQDQQFQPPQLTTTAKGAPPIVLTQHLDAPYRRLLVISAQGIVHLRLPSPLQRLRDCLATATGAGGVDGDFLSTFLHQFGPEESICASVAIAASEQRTGNTEIVGQAERAIIFFATEAARFWQPPVVARGSLLSAMAAAGTADPFQRLSFTPPTPVVGQAATTMQEQQDNTTAVSDTFLVLGVSLFLSRVARPVWRAPVLAVADNDGPRRGDSGVGAAGQQATSPLSRESGGLKSLLYNLVTTAIAKASSRGGGADSDSVIITSRLGSDDLGWILHQLRYLKAILESHSQQGWWSAHPSVGGFRSLSPTITHPSSLSRLTQDLCGLISAFIEFVGLWQVISQHNVPAVASHLTEDQRTDLLTLPVEAFVCWMPPAAASPATPLSPPPSPHPSAPVDIRSALIAALIEHYLTDGGTSVEALCSRLRVVCPNLFGNEDALCARAEELLMRAAAATTPGSSPSSTNEMLICEAADLLQSAGPGLNLGLAAVDRLGGLVGAWRPAVSLCLSVAQRRDPGGVAITASCFTPGTGGPTSHRPAAALTPSENQIIESRYDAYRNMVECLNRLLEKCNLPAATTTFGSPCIPSSQQPAVALAIIGPCPSPDVARAALHDVLKLIIKSEDSLAHFEVIGWLLSHEFIEEVIALDSPHLEAYLHSRIAQQPGGGGGVALRKLLWRQLESRGARLEAAQVLEHLGTCADDENGGNLQLDDRLDYLARAIITIKALPQSQLADCADYLVDLQDRLDVGELQRHLCVELRGSQHHSSTAVEKALRELTRGPLLSASELFTSYADPFDLHESKLLLLHFAGEVDPDLVEAIWTALIHRLLLNSPASSPGLDTSARRRQRISATRRSPPRGGGLNFVISSTLQRLYTRLALLHAPLTSTAGGGSEITTASSLWSPGAVDYSFFPITTITSMLERFAIQQALPAKWVPSIFADAKIPSTPEIAEAYNIILCKKDPFWMRDAVRSRLMEVIYLFVADFIETANRLPLRQRQLQASRMLDHLTTHLVELQAEPPSSAGPFGGGDLSRQASSCGGQGHRQLVVENLRVLRRTLDRMVATSQ